MPAEIDTSILKGYLGYDKSKSNQPKQTFDHLIPAKDNFIPVSHGQEGSYLYPDRDLEVPGRTRMNKNQYHQNMNPYGFSGIMNLKQYFFLNHKILNFKVKCLFSRSSPAKAK